MLPATAAAGQGSERPKGQASNRSEHGGTNAHERAERMAVGGRDADIVLARPTDGAPDAFGGDYTVREAAPFCTHAFCVHWVSSTADAPNLADANHNGTPDYVDSVAAELEHVHAVEVHQLGWRDPVPDGTLGGDSRTDVYLKNTSGLEFGYAATDTGQSSPMRHG